MPARAPRGRPNLPNGNRYLTSTWKGVTTKVTTDAARADRADCAEPKR